MLIYFLLTSNNELTFNAIIALLLILTILLDNILLSHEPLV